MRYVSLDTAIDGIRSGTKSGRAQGLNDLKHVLKEKGQSLRLQRLSADEHQFILESLFKAVKEEKARLVAHSAKSRSAKVKKKSPDDLSSCSHAVRTFLEICTPSLGFAETIRDTLDHILHETVGDDGEYFEPLLDDYYKALQAILSYRPHLEHLPRKRWRELVGFCCRSLHLVNTASIRSESQSSQLVVSTRSGVGTRSGAGTRSKSSSRAETPLQDPESANNVRNQAKASEVAATASSNKRSDDLALCLDHLLSARHMNILRVAEEVLPVIFETLNTLMEENRPDTQQPCFSCLNAILFRAMTEDIELAETTFVSAIYHIRRGWGSKTASGLREQMLITMLRCQSLLPSLIASGQDGIASDLEGLLDRLQTEYSSRMLDHMLSINDIGLGFSGLADRGIPFTWNTFGMRSNNSISEALWVQLCIMADLFAQLRVFPSNLSSPQQAQDNGMHPKRIKHEHHLHSLVRACSTSQREAQLATIQLLTFVLATIRIERVDDLQMLLENLFPLMSKDSGEIAKWAMLALALVSQQDLSDKASHQEVTWLQVFQVALTRLSSARIARFACNLVDSLLTYDLVSFSEVVDNLDNLLASIDVSGPAGLSDSAIDLWRTILSLYSTNRAASYESVSLNALRWLFGIWRPSQLNLRQSELSGNSSASVQHIMTLLQLLVGEKEPPQVREGRKVLSALARARVVCDEDTDLTDFLVVDGHVSATSRQKPNKFIVKRFEPQLSARAKRTALITATDYLVSELETFLATQSGSLAADNLSLSNLRSSLVICIVSLAVADIIARSDVSRSNQLLNRAIELRDQTVQAFSHQGVTSDQLRLMRHALFTVFQDLKILPLTSFKELSYLQLAVARTARPFSDVFWTSVQKKLSSADDELLDLVPVDDTQGSSTGISISAKTSEDLDKDWLCAYTDERAYQNSVRADIYLASILPDPYSMSPENATTLPSLVVDYLLSLTPFDFLGCRPFLDSVYASKLEISPQDGEKLLAFIGTKIFESETLKRNETAMGTCLDLLNHLVDHWAATDMETDISDAANQLYEYFIEAAKRRILTPHVQVKMAKMLQRIIKKSAAHGRSSNRPSARTNLFHLLETGTVKVKYQISQNIAAIFGFFILREHDAILDDIEASIPHDPESLEVTAVRLLLLSKLASSWSTLIRRCVYAIVDATSLMPSALPYARTCLKHLGKALGMRDLRELFRLFAPQILYTWLETRAVKNLPHSIFEYGSIQELVNDTKHEIASQVVMRGKETEIEDICEFTNSTFNALLSECFGKCAAYCIARDTAVAPDADPQAANAARRLMGHVGRDEYGRLIADRFPEIVATFFRILDREDQIMRSFAKNPHHAGAQEALEQMMVAGSSQNTPPVSQQPSFRSNCLIDELEYICKRSPYDSSRLWTPALFVYVFRSLLESIHPALGQLHAAAVIRRVRILISMAHDVALSGYPLYMALGSLRVHLDNTHSAEDVVGLCRYLMNAGQSDLSQNISFLTGFIVSVLVSLKALVEKPQESTTQDVAFQATLSRANEFRAWIDKYVSSLDLSISQTTSEIQQSFRDLVASASRLQSHGNANRDSAEGELLFRLLDDVASDRQLVDEVTRREVVLLLCRDFRYSGDFRNDIFSEGAAAASHASAALQLCGIDSHDQPFDLWIMRTLGRAYASQGHVESSFRRELKERKEDADVSREVDSSSALASASAIVRLLYQVACSHRTSEAGFAERTIQSVLSKAIGVSTLKDISHAVPRHASIAMDWQIFVPPPLEIQNSEKRNLQATLLKQNEMSLDEWCVQVCLAFIDHAEGDPFLSDLRPSIIVIRHFANRAFPYILHMVLVQEAGKQEQTKKVVSGALRRMMLDLTEDTHLHMKHMLNTIIYLRGQPMPFETTKSDRVAWLDVDYRLAAGAAVQCKLFKTALLFVETALSSEGKVKGSRRSSAAKVDAPTDLLLEIFQNIDEKDYYYGVRQPASLFSMMERLDMEQAGFRSLSFRGAAFDMQSRRGENDKSSMNALIRSLNNLELSSLSQSIATSADASSNLSGEITFDAARKLERWDIPCPETIESPAMTLFKAFQTLHSTNDRDQVMVSIDAGVKSLLGPVYGSRTAFTPSPSYWATLAALVESEEILSSKGPQQLQDTWEILEKRSEWFRTAGPEHIDRLLSSRETLFSMLDKSASLQQLVRSPPKQVRQIQIMSLLESSHVYRSHGNLQKSLAATTAIEQLLPSCEELGLKIEAAARIEVSNVLWDNGEMASSIRVLQDVCSGIDLTRQDIPVGKAELLAKLAERVSTARLEQPDEVLSHYLEPAVKELRGDLTGDAAGQVFHEFATFCDQQLQNQESEADFRRIQKLRDDKAVEIQELDQMITEAPARSKERENLRSYRTKAKQWYDLDSAEFKRLQSSRDALLRQSLENYLRCLKACDSFDRDAVRFSALWLQHHDEKVANEVVADRLNEVASRKFATLMNQWTSRLLEEEDSQFQKLLSELIHRICADHPYHGMYNIFASSRSKGGKDQAAMSRWAAVNAIVKRLRGTKEIEARWLALHNSCVQYVRFASERPDDGRYKSGAKILLEKSQYGAKLQEVIGMKMPPATMKIELRKDCNYKNVPVITKWSREFSVASGLSAPKIITATASNGQRYKELFKAGNDDLRQDAIMEQVFEQVSELLISHRDTRQRRLGIRSYKVLPLTAGSGVIEFVSNTIPINDYLVPAHAEHHPTDLKASAARKIIQDAAATASGRHDYRVMEYRRVCERFHPVMRYFFMERFGSPDDWFEKRLAYTRSTAAVSMLGHILGLGDRHGHNILLDEKTGEVVHIDLGIAFEQGRILPVPELVPFRLTRDIVDGMGVTKTEGVFRRCCEFTLAALRDEHYSIMTILDVLRYDPLYSWSLSPLRLKRLQTDKMNDEDESTMNSRIPGADKPEKKENEEAEAERALTVVAKKLSKSLSVEATVNELIQQASDERNLALLFAGWAAYI